MKCVKNIKSLVIGLAFVGLMLSYGINTYAQAKRAFLIGISNYHKGNLAGENEWHNIHGANDINLLSPSLKNMGYDVISLSNESATANNIRKGLKRFAQTCKSGDMVYLHFSGHGQPVEDMDGDEEDGWDEAFIPVDAAKNYIEGKYTGENHITDDELNKFFKAIRSKVGRTGYVTVVIDACHAGSSYRGDGSEDSVITRGTNTGFTARGTKFVPKIDRRSKIKVEKSANLSEICLIEACRSYQANNEIKSGETYYGSLSFYVNKILQSGNTNLRGHWYDAVIELMSKDPRLVRQNPVIETSE